MKEDLNFGKLFIIILNRFYIVLIFLLFGFFAGYLYNNSRKTEIYYQASLEVEFSLVSEEDEYIESTDKIIMNDYIELLKDEELIQETIDLLDIDVSYNQIIDRLIVTLCSEKPTIKISYKDYDAIVAENFILELYNNFSSKTFDAETDKFAPVKEVVVEKKTVSEKKDRYVVSGLMLGLVFGITFVYGLYFVETNRER